MKQAQNARKQRGRPAQRKGRSNNNSGGNRFDNRSRGNPKQLLEKYKTQARDMLQAGDRVNAEYYLQFADHYQRLVNEQQSNQNNRESQNNQSNQGNQNSQNALENQGNREQQTSAGQGNDGQGSDTKGDRGRRTRGRRERPNNGPTDGNQTAVASETSVETAGETTETTVAVSKSSAADNPEIAVAKPVEAHPEFDLGKKQEDDAPKRSAPARRRRTPKPKLAASDGAVEPASVPKAQPAVDETV